MGSPSEYSYERTQKGTEGQIEYEANGYGSRNKKRALSEKL